MLGAGATSTMTGLSLSELSPARRRGFRDYCRVRSLAGGAIAPCGTGSSRFLAPSSTLLRGAPTAGQQQLPCECTGWEARCLAPACRRLLLRLLRVERKAAPLGGWTGCRAAWQRCKHAMPCQRPAGAAAVPPQAAAAASRHLPPPHRCARLALQGEAQGHEPGGEAADAAGHLPRVQRCLCAQGRKERAG
jgi:hypothetical protein